MKTFEAVMQGFAAIPDDAFVRPYRWREEDLNIYAALYRSVEEEQTALVRALVERRPTEVQLIFARAQAAYGDLSGMLIGFGDECLDLVPDESDTNAADLLHSSIKGRSTIRQVLRHVMGVEGRTVARLEWSLSGHRDQIASTRPGYEDAHVVGGMAEILHRFGELRSETNRKYGTSISAEKLTRPAGWSKTEVDLRFILNRFASHIFEHIVQLDAFKIEAIGLRQSQAMHIVRRIWMTRGELEVIADPSVLDGLTAAHAEKLATIKETLAEAA